MKRKIKIFIILFVLLIIYIYVANITLFPKSILLMQGEKLNLATLWGIELKEKDIFLIKYKNLLEELENM